jgi:hypothetical protein
MVNSLRHSFLILNCVVAGFCAVASAQGAVNVTQHHNHASRDGLYIEPAFTPAAAANLKRDTNFSGAVTGNIYAQPLYIEDGPGGRAMIIAVTESNNVYALDAASGGILWQRAMGTPVFAKSQLGCGDIFPLGITGTPVVDLPSRTLFFDAMTTPDGGPTKKHLIYALNVDTGTNISGWPVDANATVIFTTNVFTSATQNQRSALALMGDTVYVTYGGHSGDCGVYYGWIVGVPMNSPSNLTAWATAARGGGSWSVGGVASDGVSAFMATGNTFGAGNVWRGGEAIIRFQNGASFTTATNDFWAPTNWPSLDSRDADLGGSGPIVVDVPGATPSALMVALGKDGFAYLLNRTNLGGVSKPLAAAPVSSGSIIQAAATYQTKLGTYVVFNNQSSLTALRITASNPPTIITNVWTKSQNGRGSPFVTSTDGTNNVIVWGIGAESDQRMHGFDGDTGNVVFGGGGATEVMAGTHRFSTAIAARGRIYVGTDNKIYAFTLPVSPIVVTNLTLSSGAGVQFSFTNSVGMGFMALTSTNLSLPLTNWTRVGFVPELLPGQFQFTSAQANDNLPHFYRVHSP